VAGRDEGDSIVYEALSYAGMPVVGQPRDAGNWARSARLRKRNTHSSAEPCLPSFQVARDLQARRAYSRPSLQWPSDRPSAKRQYVQSQAVVLGSTRCPVSRSRNPWVARRWPRRCEKRSRRMQPPCT